MPSELDKAIRYFVNTTVCCLWTFSFISHKNKSGGDQTKTSRLEPRVFL